MRIVLIRHAQDERGYRGGWSQRGLIEEGLLQAQALAQYLCVHRLPIDHLISSDLRRTAETASFIAKELQLPVHYAPEWREFNNGELAGMANSLADQLYPGLYASSLGMDEAYPGGESPRQFYQRIIAAFETLSSDMLSQHLPANVAVVTHAGCINMIYHYLRKVEWHPILPFFRTAPSGLNELCYQDGRWQFTIENSTKHLDELQ